MTSRRDFVKHGLRLAAAVTPVSRAVPSGVQSDASVSRSATFSDTLEAKRSATRVTGASFALWDGQLHVAVAGLRNSVTRDPVTLDTAMHVGSITKIMNATLVMQLVDERIIALDDPVLSHLPELRTLDMAALHRVTCEMLINHTSGINCEWLPEYGPDKERIEDSVARCADVGQLFEPGEAASYNNMATVIAGYLVQKLRGKSWYTLVKTQLYEPLGLRHSLVDPLEIPRHRVSCGDLTDERSGRLVQTTRPFLAPSFAPAGSTQMMSATDLVTFARALLNGGVGPHGARILSEASAQRMTRPTAEFVQVGGAATKIGLGWMIEPAGALSHGGGGPGVSSQLYADPKTGRVAVLLTNCDRGEALQAAFLQPIVQSWTGVERRKLIRVPGPLNTSAYVGSYQNNADRFTISAAPDGLELRTRDLIDTYDNSGAESAPTRLYSVGNDTFESDSESPGDGGRCIRFVRPGPDGLMRFLASSDRLLARTQV